ncbi:uncharacterized protein LY89DRAFT_682041 [Mollisia scopiformis]|uniref:Uncharacterized protein n=1 Tax=Mollisia scopiformis TaxID=149040 RepID=A0A194XJF0_MOLSC|nr:uncharacterized protein LY89DRAFT_682041 [Mollisia scopiformis]KUJ20283.1 hypothetical protein LY89DRAFT_682041 [Mollisia scopiformis]
MFFTSWALWEQMTFILGLAILLVFAIGYGKLLYTNRLVQKQEVVDEEKRMRIQELRSSGQIVESRKSHDIPFGIRAIQSGIQIDGIWISQGSTPVPSELKLGHLRGSSTDMIDPDPNKEAQFSSETTAESLRPSSRQGRPLFRAMDSSNLILDKVYEASDTERPNTARSHASYKPRRASHLRHGSHGQYDEETLGHLEGISPSPKRKVHAHRPRSTPLLDAGADSSAADNEHSSTGVSDSDTSLSHKLQEADSSSPQFFFSEPDVRNATSLSISNVPSGNAVRASLPMQRSKAEYFSVPLDSPRFESSDPFATPLASPLESVPMLKVENSPLVQEPSPPADYQTLPLQPSRSPSPFIPGELHVNKTVRKVNSGFEVLPAGTFGVPPEFKGKGIDLGEDDDSGDRRQSRLQKKPRTSMTVQRTSGTIEHP